ncbi:S8 family serine peptidase [Ornithinimicrobium cryptoxanthini]|uniref:S8 family serine peptidase n=1 Tax=Ornithinimicrobium cryptoxanthini TaxID=2934161 RepID=UPI0022B65B6B|nr:S8 family serine peptidase [Ornithinimicrobium cryptoxanthini]
MTTGAAALALAITTVSSGGAFADGSDSELTPLEQPGAPASQSKFQDGTLQGVEQTPSAYFVQLRANPAIKGGSTAAVQSQADTFLAHAESVGADLQVRETYQSVWSGISVSGSRADVERAASSRDVVAVFPVYQLEVPDVPAAGMQPQMAFAKGMTGVDEAHDMGYTGDGMRIGIIDTGVDIDHPDFGGSGTPTDGLHQDWRTAQVRFGYDLVGDAYDASNPETDHPVGDGNPDDCQGHGTHVAGIAAGNGDETSGGVVGVAPDALIGAYRVFGCNGSTNTDIMLSAMELAYEDGMDVVNMSLGIGWSSWKQYPSAQASDSMVDAGIVVVNSIGNEGASGTFSAGAPGVSDKAIGVASYDNIQMTVNSVTVSPDDTPVGYVNATGAAPTPTEGTTVLSTLGAPGSAEARACVPVTADLTGTTVLIERGAHADYPDCDASFYNKALQGQEAGAEAVIIYNNVPGLINPTVEPPTPADPAITIPVIFIQQADGVMISDRVAAGETTLTWTDERTTIPTPTAGLISSFSSYGMTAELELKPDLGAPGGHILSTYPLEQGGYASLGGTSMSSPHVAGTAALLLQARPELSTEQIRTVLQNSADPAVWSLNPGIGLLDSVHRQGAGMVDIDDAILSSAIVSPGKLSLGETDAGPVTRTIAITNTSDAEISYALANNDATIATDGIDYTPGYWGAAVGVAAPATVTVAPGATQVFDVTFTGPAMVPDMQVGLQYGGYLEFEPTGGTAGDILRVPYAGYAGDYQDRPVLMDGPYEFTMPVLGVHLGGGSYDVFPETGTGDEPVYTLVGEDDPVILAEFGHQARQVELTAYQATADGSQGAEVGVVYTEDYLRRSEAPGDFLAFAWDGTFEGETVADGKYLLEMTITKAQAFNDTGAAATETYLSEPFTIDDAQTAPTAPEVTRYDGYDRYSTAAKISAQNYDAGVDTVYIATGDTFPDALAGAARAGSEGAPVLLVKSSSIPAATQFELDRLQPGSIVIFGGDTTVTGAVESLLRDYTDGTVSRMAGINRFETAAAISADLAPGVDTVFIANGYDFPDALTGAARAGTVDAPVLLTRTGSLPAATRAELDRLNPDTVVILGGPNSVSGTVQTQLATYGDVERRAGANRYDTAVEVSSDFSAGLDTVFVATGENFPDALTGAALAGHVHSPVLLVKPNSIPASVVTELKRLGAGEIQILGGHSSVSQAVEDQLMALTYP